MHNLILILLALLLPGVLNAQTTGFVTINTGLPFFGTTKTQGANGILRGSDGVSLSVSVGYEMRWRRPGKQFAPGFSLRFGRILDPGLANNFRGTGVQINDPENPMPVQGQLYGQARLVGVATAELSLGAEVMHDKKVRGYVGGGLLMITNERVHATTSWIDPNPEGGFSYAACCGRYEEIDGEIQQDLMADQAGGAGNLYLSRTMLNRFIPYLEAQFSLQAGERTEMYLGLQVGVLPAIDKSWYNGVVSGGTWFSIQTGARGALFRK